MLLTRTRQHAVTVKTLIGSACGERAHWAMRPVISK
jgi:hypothetical protein